MPTWSKELDGLFSCVRAVAIMMRSERFRDLVADGVDGVEVGEGVLEDHGDFFAVDLAARFGPHLQKIVALIEDAASGDIAGRAVDQVHDRGSGHALAGPAFPQDGEGLAAV